MEVIADVAERLLRAGAASVSAWGPDCERVHDILDEVLVADGSDALGRGDHIPTTWHADEPLSEAIWTVLFGAPGAATDSRKAPSVLGVVIGSPTWRDEVVSAFSDPQAFSARMLAGE